MFQPLFRGFLFCKESQKSYMEKTFPLPQHCHIVSIFVLKGNKRIKTKITKMNDITKILSDNFKKFYTVFGMEVSVFF